MGDFVGHPFRGNQYTQGGVSVSRGDYLAERPSPYAEKILAGLKPTDEYNREKVNDIFNSGRFVTKVKTREGYFKGTTEYVVDVRPRKGEKAKLIPPQYPGDTRKRYYDPTIASINPGSTGRLFSLKPGWSDSVSELTKREDGKLFRGMSQEELQGIFERGKIQSRGEYNLGEQEKGLTYFSVDPGQAESYAHGFAPFNKQSTGSTSAFVIEVRDPKRGGTMVRDDERGVPGSVGIEDVVAVYEGRAYTSTPGRIEYVVGRDGKTLEEGSRNISGGSIAWRKVPIESLKGRAWSKPRGVR